MSQPPSTHSSPHTSYSPRPQTSDAHSDPLHPFTPNAQPPNSPTPAFSRPPSTIPITPPNSRYPAVRNLTSTHSPRTPAVAARLSYSHLQSSASPSTYNRAVNTALPNTPPQVYRSPPSAFTPRLHEAVELHPLTPRHHQPRILSDSPFDDRHSIYVEETPTNVDEEDPFEYNTSGSESGKQKTMSGYQFTNMSPTHREWDKKDMSFGPGLMEVRPISEARRSLYPGQYNIPSSTLEHHPDLLRSPATIPSPTTRHILDPIKPTFRGLFSLTTPRDYVIYLLPAFLCSVGGALIQPYMSQIIGDVFDVLTQYPLDNAQATPADRQALVDGVRLNTTKLVVAGAVAAALNYAKGVLWQIHGEAVVDRLRRTVYCGVQNKGMEWYDLGMGMKEETEEEEGESIGAGGLMAKFTR